MLLVRLSGPNLLRSLRSPLFCLLALLSGLAAPVVASAQVTFQNFKTLVPVISYYPFQDQVGGVAVDASGNIYAILDQFNFSSAPASQSWIVVQFSPQTGGTYSQTVLATSNDRLTSLAVDSSGNVYYTDYTASAVIELTPSGGTFTSATLPITVPNPLAIAVDASDNLYLAKAYPNTIYMESYSAGTYTQSTIGTPAYPPLALKADPSGNVYVADGSAGIEIFQKSNNYALTTVAVTGNSPGYAWGIALDSSGNVYVSDANNSELDEFIPSNGSYTQVTLATENGEYLALAPTGNVIIGSSFVIQEYYGPSVNFPTQPVAATSGTSTNTIALPFSVSYGQTVGSVKILTTGASGKDFTDAGSSTCTAQTYSGVPAASCVVNVNFTPLAPGLRQGAVVIFDGNNVPLVTVPLYGTGTGPLPTYAAVPTTYGDIPTGTNGFAFDGAGNLYTANGITGQVLKTTPNGVQTNVGSGFSNPSGIAVDGAGNLYIVDSYNLYEVTPAGVQTQLANGLTDFTFVAVDGSGNLYFQQYPNSSLTKLAPSGATTQIGSGIQSAVGIALDSAGNLYVADYATGDIYEITPSGSQSTLVNGRLDPTGLALDAAGNIYFGGGGGTVQERSTDGTLTTIGSDGIFSYGIALDNAGNIYYADPVGGNSYLNEILRGYSPAFNFANTQQGSESTDSAKTQTVTNIGNAPLTFSAISYPADFPEDSSGAATDCTASTSLAPNADCTFTVDFKPVQSVTANTPLFEAVTATTNYLTSPYQYVNVAGTETNPPAATPFFSVNGGALNNPQPVAIFDTTPGAVVYYTINGTTPTTASPVYSGPISLPYGFTLQAIAIASGYSQSSVQSATYTFAAAAPTAFPAAGTYSGPQSVVLSSASTAAKIFYTTNGTTPTASSARYTGPITVSANETLTFIAAGTGYASSAPVVAQYYINPAPNAPTFSPAGGNYNNAQPITLSDNSSGATYYYTVDGTQPTTASLKYNGSIAMHNGQTVNAAAYIPGYGLGPVGTATYTLTAATPAAIAPAGTYTGTQSVTLSSPTTGAVIYYTTNGTVPTTSSAVYTAPIQVAASETIEFFAALTGYANSPIVTAAYYISAAPVAPSFSLAAGTYNNSQTATISEATAGATIYYTLNGTTPTAASTKYTGPIPVNYSLTLNAIAIQPGYSTPSPVASATYTLAAATPSVSLSTGTYSGAQQVTLSTATANAILVYTTNGKNPTSSSTPYTGPITVGSSETLKVIAIATGYSNSQVVSNTYTIQ